MGKNDVHAGLFIRKLHWSPNVPKLSALYNVDLYLLVQPDTGMSLIPLTQDSVVNECRNIQAIFNNARRCLTE